MNGTYSCQISNRTITNIDELGCSILRAAAFLFYYDFGYICLAPIGFIIVISIFGRLKGHYRWLILNQAIWDLFASSYYSCGDVLTTFVKKPPSCFFMPKTYISNPQYWHTHLELFLGRVITFNSYSALLLLSTSRFLALYFPHAYAKLIKGRNILYMIISFNLISILFDINPIFLSLQTKTMYEKVNECIIQQNSTKAMCTAQRLYEKDSLWKFYRTLSLSFLFLQNLKPPLFLFLSMIASILIIWKIAKQVKFQIKQDRKDFSSSVRIAIVIGLQNIINFFGVFLEAFNQLIPLIIYELHLKIATSRNFSYTEDYILDLRFPLWLDGPFGLSSVYFRGAIIQIRILIESFIILVIMTGYREAVMDFFKYVYNVIRSPNQVLKKFKFISNNPTLSMPSLF